ncbi:MAG TPA: HXXEE domain-containing protein [Gemmatimonadaceae bacterium]|nr:HXXEE domain-containing protein [Gemmatimonadaceae bacterium]
MSEAMLWLPFVAIALHMTEEFVWPGGFGDWYRNFPPGRTARVSTRFLVIINLVFVALAVLPPMLGANSRGYAYWLLVAAIAVANGVFHLVATIRYRAYSPGVITGSLLYLPLGVVGAAYLLRAHLTAPAVVAQAAAFAVAYAWWSSWKHGRASQTA